MLLAAVLLAACNGSDDVSDLPDGSGSAKADEIRLNADVWHVMEGTRATTIDGGTLTSGSFKAASYVENTITAYINPVQVNWSDSKWNFSDGKHYWPATDDLDFFAYMPETAPSYITTGPTYSAPGTPGVPQAQFTCENLPMTYDASDTEAGQGSDLEEFIWGITVGQNKANQGVSGVTMKFRHPFARIKFQLAANHHNVQINSITFKNLKTGGTCTLNNTAADTYYYTTSVWSDLTPAEGGTDLVMSFDGDGQAFNDNPATPTPIGPDFIMIPQDWAGEIVVNADCLFWGEKKNYPSLTTTIPTTWQPGYSYTYTFTINPDNLIVNISKFTEQW